MEIPALEESTEDITSTSRGTLSCCSEPKGRSEEKNRLLHSETYRTGQLSQGSKRMSGPVLVSIQQWSLESLRKTRHVGRGRGRGVRYGTPAA